jgi:PhzF family phenazine biosynthesis protein
MHVQTLHCFGVRPGEGNPALVVEQDGFDAGERQRYVADQNTTCVFLDERRGGFMVDYFYPHMRSPLCLHATLAVAAVLFARGAAGGDDNNNAIAVETAMQGQRLLLSRDADGADSYYVQLTAQAAPDVGITPQQIASLLGAPDLALPSNPRVASVGSPKLLVEVANTDTLYTLTPDLPGIAAWGRAHGVNGLYVYSRLADGSYEGRNFNHLDPALEDSATGVAAGALSVALGRGLVLHQGRATGRDCLIRTQVDVNAIRVGGSAR